MPSGFLQPTAGQAASFLYNDEMPPFLTPPDHSLPRRRCYLGVAGRRFGIPLIIRWVRCPCILHAQKRKIDRTTPRHRLIYKGTGQQDTSDIAWNYRHWPIVGCRHTDSPYWRIAQRQHHTNKQVQEHAGLSRYRESFYTLRLRRIRTHGLGYRVLREKTVTDRLSDQSTEISEAWWRRVGFYIPNRLFGNARLARYSRSRALVSRLAATDVVIVAIDSHVLPLWSWLGNWGFEKSPAAQVIPSMLGIQ